MGIPPHLIQHQIVIHHLQFLAPSPSLQQLPPDFGRHFRVTLDLQEIQQHIPLVFGNIIPVPLGERQEALVPKDGQVTLVRLEAHKVKDQGVDDLVGESILFVDKGLDEDRRGAGVVHFAEMEESGGGVENGNGDASKDGANNLGLLESAGPALWIG